MQTLENAANEVATEMMNESRERDLLAITARATERRGQGLHVVLDGLAAGYGKVSPAGMQLRILSVLNQYLSETGAFVLLAFCLYSGLSRLISEGGKLLCRLINAAKSIPMVSVSVPATVLGSMFCSPAKADADEAMAGANMLQGLLMESLPGPVKVVMTGLGSQNDGLVRDGLVRDGFGLGALGSMFGPIGALGGSLIDGLLGGLMKKKDSNDPAAAYVIGGAKAAMDAAGVPQSVQDTVLLDLVSDGIESDIHPGSLGLEHSFRR
jgi:hypothetical protein